MDQPGKEQRDLFESRTQFPPAGRKCRRLCACTCSTPRASSRSWNIGGQRIKGYLPAEILGQHFSRFYTEPDRANGKPARALAHRRTARPL